MSHEIGRAANALRGNASSRAESRRFLGRSAAEMVTAPLAPTWNCRICSPDEDTDAPETDTAVKLADASAFAASTMFDA